MKTIEIFEIVEKHMLTQKDKSYYIDPVGELSCAYRGMGKLKCAVGCLITEEAYTPELEGQGVLFDEDVHRALEKSLGINPSKGLLGLLDDLQSIHDARPVKAWKAELERLRADVEGGCYEDEQ